MKTTTKSIVLFFQSIRKIPICEEAQQITGIKLEEKEDVVFNRNGGVQCTTGPTGSA